MFLHRDELADRWDWSVCLDVPFTETARRMAARDGTHPIRASDDEAVRGGSADLARFVPATRAGHGGPGLGPVSDGLTGSAEAREVEVEVTEVELEPDPSALR